LRALMHLGLTRIKYVDLQKCCPVKLGEALSWCCVPLLRRIAVRAGCLEELRSSDRMPGMLVRLAEKLGPGEPVRFECGSPSFAACP
jgi:hypothetical protein